jgi:hypothetical protein
MFRRRGQRLLRGMGNPNIPPMLLRANQLMESGDYAGAADAYTQLARGAETRFPRRAPFLFMAAGHAATLSDQVEIGIAHLRRGLKILASQGRILRMQTLGQRAIEELKARNLNAEAEEIQNLLNSNMQEEIPEAASTAKKPILTTHCPSCGGAVRPDEIEWLDEITAECAYCGSPVR